MPTRIYDISKKLGLENKEVLAKAKELGITAAKIPSSSLDRITAEYLETHLTGGRPVIAPPPIKANELDGSPQADSQLSPVKPCIAITVTGTELYRLFEQILSGEVRLDLNISENENSEPLRVILTKDGSNPSTEAKSKLELPPRREIDERTKRLLRAAYHNSTLNSSEEWINLAEYGNAVKKLDPNFHPQYYGERSLGSLLRRLSDNFELRNDELNPIVYHLRMKSEVFSSASRSSSSNIPTPQTPIVPFSHLRRVKGKIHNLRLGFGFIMPDDGSPNLFFHATDVEDCTLFDLKPGDAVEYEPGMNEKGPCALKIRRIV